MIWNALGEGHFADIARLLILTGQRPREISNLRWSEIDMGKALISLPGSRTKNKRTHDIPSVRPRWRYSSVSRAGWAGSLYSVKAQGFQGFSKAKAALDARAKIGEPWQLRDIRRTVVTGLNHIGVLPHVVEAVVNHVSGSKAGVAGIYNKAVYAKEKVEAMKRWDAGLVRLVGRG